MMVGVKNLTDIGKSTKKTQVKSKVCEVERVDEILSEDDDQSHEEDDSIDSEKDDNENKALHDSNSTSNTGWADVMQKILKTKRPKRKKTVVLAKAKKLCDVKVTETKEEIPFEIDGVENEIKTESEEANIKIEEPSTETKSKRKDHLGIRIKPSITDRERERMLQKIATKGVVQLFNAVKQQQIEINKKLSKAGPLERKREQVLKSIDKNAFLDILMGDSKSISVDNEVKSEEVAKQTTNKDKDDKMWSVLRDDFVMGAKMKDWDKKNTDEEDSSAPEDMDSDE